MVPTAMLNSSLVMGEEEFGVWTRVGLKSCLHVAVSARGSSFIATADLQVGIPMAAHSHVCAALGTRARSHQECSPPPSPGSNSALQSGSFFKLFRYQGSCAGVPRLRPATRFVSTSQHSVPQSGRWWQIQAEEECFALRCLLGIATSPVCTAWT
jgi:hypothetical protein